MPRPLAWAATFLFVNLAWVFFRAKTMEDAERVLAGMVNISSIKQIPVAALPTSALAWGGVFSDELLRLFPSPFIAHAPAFFAITAAFVLIAQRNSMQISAGRLSTGKLACGTLMLIVAMYFSLASANAVFLYFNF